MDGRPVTDLNTLFDQLNAFKLAPIDDWKPTKTVYIDIRIATNGEWFYLESPIQRHRIVKLFSTVLRLEGDQYFLITPPVKYQIQVDDVPFTAVEMNCVKEHSKEHSKAHSKAHSKEKETQKLYFRTNMDEVILADPIHPLTIITNEKNGQLVPYITVRNNLKAKITRSVFYQLAALLQPAPEHSHVENTVGVFSAGRFFSFGTVMIDTETTETTETTE